MVDLAQRPRLVLHAVVAQGELVADVDVRSVCRAARGWGLQQNQMFRSTVRIMWGVAAVHR